MTCCTPFSPAGTAAVPSPSQHVNFTTGMVLGVDDYRAEFAYHSARDQWIMREAGGSGTLAGLEVMPQADGANGPRIRVTAGSAAAPSGQLICVARDQCASLNAWLADATVTKQVGAIAALGADPAKTRLSLWLTLCYVDCTALPVPIPGQPCRSEDDLMANSRVMDDYRLALSFTSPLHTEARALRLLQIYESSWVIDATAPNTAAARKALDAKLGKHLRALFTSGDSFSAADLAPPTLHPDLRPFLRRRLRQLWITRVRPLVMAQSCAAAPRGEDCVLLARIVLPVVKAGSHWEVDDGGAPLDAVQIDEGERSFIENPALAATLFGTAAVPDPLPGSFEVVTGAGNLGTGTAAALIRLGADGDVVIPAGTAAGAGRWLWLRSQGPGKVTLKVAGGGMIAGEASRDLATGETILLVADGAGQWAYGAGGPVS
ncbi:hypothetical protein [Erythrobacter oryzae]|uniref:hypothetical protein n=1 Tax=Erythrobacter oryzae TaxID=3019556 RepID=UPI002552D297|nr:hypothetical protein [Erythrobacter sp. COR-2]